MDKWVRREGGREGGWEDGWMGECRCEWVSIGRCVGEDERVDGWVNGLGWMGGWVDG